MSNTNIIAKSHLVEVAERYCDGRASADELARAYYKDTSAKNIVVFVCNKYRLDDQIDEVHQLVCTKLVESLKNATAVYGLVKVLAGRRCIDVLRSRIAKPEYSYDAIIESLGESAHFVVDSLSPTLGDHATHVGRAIDTQKAEEKFTERLQKNFARYEAVANLYLPIEANYSPQDLVEAPPRTEFAKPTVKPPTPSKRVQREKVTKTKGPKVPKLAKETESKRKKLSSLTDEEKKERKEQQKIEKQHKADAKEITDLRTALNLTNFQMAEALDMTEAMFCYTLYSKSKPIKTEVMDKVRKLRQNVAAERLKTQTKLVGVDASELITKWMSQLKIDPQSKTANQDFGDFVKASRSTVWRWRNKNLTPKPGKLLEMQKLVDAKLKKSLSASTDLA